MHLCREEKEAKAKCKVGKSEMIDRFGKRGG